MEYTLPFNESDLNTAKNFFSRVNGINPDFVTIDSMDDIKDTIYVGGDPSYTMYKGAGGITVHCVNHHYHHVSGWEDSWSVVNSRLSFDMALQEIALALTKDKIKIELMVLSYDPNEYAEEPSWDGCCRCSSNEDNPCVCD